MDAADVGGLKSDVLGDGPWRSMIFADLQARFAEAVAAEREAWRGVASVEAWERFRDERLERMVRSFGPATLGELSIEVTGELQGEGYVLRKIVYETRPGILVTALLYLPDPTPASMPGIQICHAHHRPKHQGELQDMGVIWARAGCAVLVPDMVGYGERRQDPFGERQGYYSRYYEAMQLDLIGESLIGWMVWDLMRGVDVLFGLPDIDAEKIIMIGAVAGGGDPAAMAAALDSRVTCSIPFNFGRGSGWRTDLAGPAPEGANLAGWGYWETTRSLRGSACGQFFPWLIMTAAAPRYLVNAHEFEWDAQHDEAWERMQKVYEMYGARDRLGWQKGAGQCAPGEGNTHCTNVGPIHRAGLYPYLEQWFGLTPPEEMQDRREKEELACLTSELAAKKQTVQTVAAQEATYRLEELRQRLGVLDIDARREQHRSLWAEALGDVEPAPPSAEVMSRDEVGGVTVERIRLDVEERIAVPMVLLRPGVEAAPVVVGVAQQGKGAFLTERAGEVARLLDAGVAVCLVDVRGTGETALDDSHGLNSEYIDASERERMLGGSLLARQLRDLRSALAYLRTRGDLDASRLALWGDSFAPVNPAGFIPGEHSGKQVDQSDWPNAAYGPYWAEPLGQMLVLLAALFEDDVRGVLARRGLVGFASIYDSYFFCVPSDVIVPGAMAAGDVADLAASTSCPVRLEGPVDACNREVGYAELQDWFPVALPESVVLSDAITFDAADWLAHALL
jgi:dienelactone hydrolase